MHNLLFVLRWYALNTLQWYAALTEGHRVARVATTPRRPLCRTSKLTPFTSESLTGKQILHYSKSCQEEQGILWPNQIFWFWNSFTAKLWDSRFISTVRCCILHPTQRSIHLSFRPLIAPWCHIRLWCAIKTNLKNEVTEKNFLK